MGAGTRGHHGPYGARRPRCRRLQPRAVARSRIALRPSLAAQGGCRLRTAQPRSVARSRMALRPSCGHRRSDVRRLALTIVSGGVLREQMSAAVLNRGPSARCANTGRPRGRRRARHPAPAKHSERVPPLPPLRTSPRTTPLPSLRRRHARSLAPPPAPTPLLRRGGATRSKPPDDQMSGGWP